MVIDSLTPENESERIDTAAPMILDSNDKNEVVQLNEAISTMALNDTLMEEITVFKVTLNDTIASKYLSSLKKQVNARTADSLSGQPYCVSLLPFSLFILGG